MSDFAILNANHRTSNFQIWTWLGIELDARTFIQVHAPSSFSPTGSVRGLLFCDNNSIRSKSGRASIEAKPWKVFGDSGQDPLG